MRLKVFLFTTAGLLAYAACACQGVGCVGALVSVAAAILAGAHWSGRENFNVDCAPRAAVIITLGLVVQWAHEYPVAHEAFHQGWLPCGVLDLPVLGCLMAVWLDAEHVLGHPMVMHLSTCCCIGLCCGLASVQAFAGPLAARRQMRVRSDTAGARVPARPVLARRRHRASQAEEVRHC